MLNCNQVSQLVSESRERPLTLKERIESKIHLMMCSGCRDFKNNVDIIHKAMHKFSGGIFEKKDDDREC